MFIGSFDDGCFQFLFDWLTIGICMVFEQYFYGDLDVHGHSLLIHYGK